ncbi:SpoIIE family protein phosphatase [Vicingus serpentipes]|uniref:SpoIIE family protein phosphatase n=2 Tax=Vicingus serpentipes TaxID=1926625 RepID=A0A5C6RUC8_9FLAO|nr:SpoIIE family protein phosphatase [Vicingus serpentipes]
MFNRAFFVFLTFLCCSIGLFGQFSKPFVSNYTAKDYNAFFQNWDAVQDKHGIMYFANNYGVLTFNGNKWDVISSPNESIIRSLAIASNGKVVAGGYDQIGFLETDEKGSLNFSSISDSIDESFNDFGSVWNIVVEKDRTYFSTDKYILKYQDNKLSKLVDKGGQLFAKIKNRIYTTTTTDGLVEFKNEKIEPLPDGDFFTGMKIYSVVANRKGLMVVTRNSGLYYYSADTIYEIGDKKTKEIFKSSELYSAIELPDGNVCLSTLKNGIIIINQIGEIVEIFNSESGVQNQTCWSAYHDKQGNIWLMLDKGITKIEYNCPFSLYNQNVGIDGTIMSITRFNNKLYLATSVGLYEVNKQETQYGDKLVFNLKTKIKSQCWDLLEVNNHLLIATSSGIYSLNKQGVITRQNNDITYTLEKSNYYSNLVFAGKESEVSFILFSNLWKEYSLDTLKYQVRSLYEESENNLWLGTYVDGAINLTYELTADFSPKNVKHKSYSVDEGLFGYEVDVFSYQNEMVFSTDKGLMKKKEETNGEFSFYLDTILGNSFANGTRIIYRLQEDYLDNVWMYAPVTIDNNNEGLGYVKTHNNTPIWNYEQFNRLPQGIIYAMYPEINGDIWLGGVEGLMKYNYIKNTVKYNSIFYSLINKVSLGKDSIIHKGDYFIRKNSVKIGYDYNSLQFEFSCTNFLDEKRNKYQYKLEGFDEEWSDWTNDTKKQYTNLYEGNYKFRVRSKNTYNNKGIEATYKFIVLPPWYRTWYAYVIYGVLLIVLIYIIVRVSVYRLKVANEKLEGVIAIRTKEIREKNTQLGEALTDIKDSINYAKRLQEAILPKQEEVKNIFPQNFIYYLPRDIVSGDFYWTTIQNNKRIFVVADCTGHGVPGAFVSMLGNDLLNHIISENQITDTSNILTKLNKGVLNAFNNDDISYSTNDGMDIAVISIDENNVLQYSGANRPLTIVRDKEVIEFKPDKKSIGGRTELDFVFKPNTIQLLKNDNIYMYSDGFADQFGGEKGKKYLTKRLKQLLVEVSDMAIATQKNKIEKEFLTWKGSINQLDDVLLTGIKID